MEDLLHEQTAPLIVATSLQ